MLHAYDLEQTILIVAAFIAPLVFLAAYSYWHAWWGTVHGRTLAAISVAIPVVLLHGVLTYWHLLGPNGSSAALGELAREARTDPRVATALARLDEALDPDAGDWLTLQFMVLIPIGFGIMAYQVVQPHAGWLLRRVRRDDPLTRDAEDTPVRSERPSSR